MKLRQLENFISVCELGSISKAAECCHVAQPALGLQIRGMEDEMGTRLLERHARGVAPTSAGLLVLDWARETVRDAIALKQRLRTMAGGTAGSVTLGLTPSIATTFAVPLLLAVQRELPELQLRLVEGHGHLMRDWVAAGRIDVALVFDAPSATTPASRVLLTESLYFASAATDAATSAQPIPLPEVLEQPLAMGARGDSVRQTIEEAAHAIDLPLQVAYEMQATGVILRLVRAGLASTVLPLAVLLDDAAAGTLRVRRIAAPALRRQLRWMTADKSGPAVAVVQRLVERVIRAHVGPLHEAYELVPAG